MRRVIVLLCLLARVSLQMQAVQRYFIARKTRSNTEPRATGFLYNQVNNGPATLKAFVGHRSNDIEQKHNGVNNNLDVILFEKSTENSKETESSEPPSVALMSVNAKNKLWPEKANSSEKFKFGPSSILSSSYQSLFRNDDQDVRTDFINSYDIWPFFFNNIYEYEPKKVEVEAEKAIDKRFATPSVEHIIPVHEDVVETIEENSGNKELSRLDYKAVTTDNPIFGNQPFFSYVLNDYFDKTNQDYPASYKELSWGEEFDHEMALQDVDKSKRLRRLDENSPPANRKEDTETFVGHDALQESLDSIDRESDTRQKGNDDKYSYDGGYQYNGENYGGFKDYIDSFANRYGSEEHDRETNFAKKMNADKGEKKKGFRKVYHKDEYQEHHDFFDNTGNNENMEEKGASKFKIGGSEGLLRSLSGAATGNDSTKLSKTENIEGNKYENSHEDKERQTAIERELDLYRDVAKSTALSNNADYVDRR